MIEFRNVSVCYAPQVRYPIFALNDIDLHIARGEWVFFIGPSGAGKSTLLRLVYHGATAQKGRVWVEGQDISHLSSREVPLLRRKIGVVFQDFQLLPQKTVWENVAFAQQVIGVRQKQLVRDVPRAIETVGLSHKADALPHQLSGGEQQRVAIARAIVNNPTILVADEPTGNLDPQTARDVGEVLQRINDLGTTILMATHDRYLVDELQKRVVRVCDGRIISDESAGVYHPEDDLPRRDARDDETKNVVMATTALDGALVDLLTPPAPVVDPQRVLESEVERILIESKSDEPPSRQERQEEIELQRHQGHEEEKEAIGLVNKVEEPAREEISEEVVPVAAIVHDEVEPDVPQKREAFVEAEWIIEPLTDEPLPVEPLEDDKFAPRLTRNGYLEPSSIPRRNTTSTR